MKAPGSPTSEWLLFEKDRTLLRCVSELDRTGQPCRHRTASQASIREVVERRDLASCLFLQRVGQSGGKPLPHLLTYFFVKVMAKTRRESIPCCTR